MNREEIDLLIKKAEAERIINSYKSAERISDCKHDYKNNGESLGGGTEFICKWCSHRFTTPECIKKGRSWF